MHFIKEKKKMGFAANKEIKCKNSIKKWINIYISNNVFIEKVRDLKQFKKKKIKIANSFLDITRLKQAKLITFGGGLVNEIMFS